MRPATLSKAPSAVDPPSVTSADFQTRGAPSTSWLTGRLRQTVCDRFNRLSGGQIDLKDGPFHHRLGESDAANLRAVITVHNQRAYRLASLGGSLGAAESYLDGDWDCDDLTALLRIFARNLVPRTSLDGQLPAITRQLARLQHWLARNSRIGSRKNIGMHYDLGDDFFRLFLDENMMYSSAIFDDDDMSLEEAQSFRLDRICQELDLRPSDRVLEIGTGWGGFAIHAARNFGCQVTTTTISRNQYETSKTRFKQAGVADRITLLCEDYRDLQGSYDKLVSIEMVEAVGAAYLDTYFRKCGELLKPGGRMLLQAIVIPEQRYDHYLRSVDFIQRYVFPGGCLPSFTAMQQSIGRVTDLKLTEVRDFALHYARTLREWRMRFQERLGEVRRMGYSERFIRMWQYYLCYCEAAFEERAIGVVHAVWDR
jgi:cyclopropane-fatty-acyl-phospholipid synthase